MDKFDIVCRNAIIAPTNLPALLHMQNIKKISQHAIQHNSPSKDIYISCNTKFKLFCEWYDTNNNNDIIDTNIRLIIENRHLLIKPRSMDELRRNTSLQYYQITR